MSQPFTVSGLSHQLILDALPHATVVIDAAAKIIAVNRAWKRNYPDINNWYGQNYLDYMTDLQQDDKYAFCLQGIQDILNAKRSIFRFDYQRIDQSWCQIQVSPLENAQGALIQYTDTTETFDADAQMNMLLESPIDAMIIVDTHGLIQMVNTRLEQMFGYTRDELFGQSMDVLMPHRFRRQHRQHQQKYFHRPHNRPMGTGLELFGLRKDGTEFPVEISLNPLDYAGVKLVSAAIRDVSERKRTELELQRLARILETSASEIYLFDARTLRFTFANRGARENLGYTAEELFNLTPLDLKPEFTLASFQALLQPLLEGKKDYLHFSTQHQRKDRSRYPVDVTYQYFADETPPVIASIIMDITERQATQKALQESRQRIAMHVASTPLAVLEWRSSDGIITAWNPAAEHIFGYRAHEVIEKKHANFIVPEDTRHTLSYLWNGPLSETGFRSTHKNIRKDGRIISCEWYTSVLDDLDGSGQRVAALALDVTARQRAINDLITVQEEERSRISKDLHDHVGQLLTGLNLGLSTVIDHPEKQKLLELKRLASTILEDVRRISRDMRPALLDELGLESAIKRFVRELTSRETLKVDILVRVPENLDRNTATVIYRVTQEALTNIVRHARAQHTSVVITHSSEGIQLIVEDDGIGFDPSSISASDHIGLSSMRERVELLGGVFTIESILHRGTTISAKLPQ